MTPAANIPPVSMIPVQIFPPVSLAVDTGGKFAIGVNITDSKFATGVNNAGGNLPMVSMTPAANCHQCKRHRWQTMGTIIKLLTTQN